MGIELTASEVTVTPAHASRVDVTLGIDEKDIVAQLGAESLLDHIAAKEIVDYLGIEVILDQIGETDCLAYFGAVKAEDA